MEAFFEFMAVMVLIVGSGAVAFTAALAAASVVQELVFQAGRARRRVWWSRRASPVRAWCYTRRARRWARQRVRDMGVDPTERGGLAETAAALWLGLQRIGAGDADTLETDPAWGRVERTIGWCVFEPGSDEDVVAVTPHGEWLLDLSDGVDPRFVAGIARLAIRNTGSLLPFFRGTAEDWERCRYKMVV